ncbi:MAG TPA: hypothetical protein PLK24_09060 [Atribacter sp.]|uniref:hypothetical protein n=1 Tax=Atribacter sp. TaxID=2847780 RepID=UPI001769C331|nr:hypothetical protein [Atribacter sp.]MDD3714929.1 hypothetical protein [Atribacterota bacterium]HHT11458.1 hypothetical protein [Candidatus Atribacteria bacterium]HQK84072.1 hypothetical protein [Atribacter sp.]
MNSTNLHAHKMTMKTYLNPSLRGAQPFFGWTTWQSHLAIYFKKELKDEILTRESTAQDDGIFKNLW